MPRRAAARSARHQLTYLLSGLAHSGRAICRTIEATTTRPTFYPLLVDGDAPAWIAAACPGCGHDWRLPEPPGERCVYRCGACRLVGLLV